MFVPVQKFREVVFQLLYGYDVGKSSDEDMLELLSKELGLKKAVVQQAQDRMHQIYSHLNEIDALISKTSLSYTFERIQSVERNILRLGIFELFYDSSIPPKVAIAEAKRLARKFSTKESATFIHALLDSAYRLHLGVQNDNPNNLIESLKQLTESEQMKISESPENLKKDLPKE